MFLAHFSCVCVCVCVRGQGSSRISCVLFSAPVYLLHDPVSTQSRPNWIFVQRCLGGGGGGFGRCGGGVVVVLWWWVSECVNE